jgi:beta-lactamase class D
MLATLGSVSAARDTQKAASASCVMIQELTTARTLVQRGSCSTRLSPASTFKIPHALVALETGVVTIDAVERWDGTRYERQTEWNRDHTVISALRPSVLWFFQRFAPRIGAERMKSWLDTFEYGNRDVSGPIAEYWVNGRLRVSPLEQVAFLRRFYRGDLPIAAGHLKAVRQGLEQQPGAVHNSLGIHPMPGDWSKATLNAKTGATTTPSERISWLVGQLRSSGRDYVFAAAVWHADNQVEVLDAARLAVNTFIAEKLLPDRVR